VFSATHSTSTGTIPAERQNSTAQVPASSIRRMISPMVDQSVAASSTSATPLR
jgi:hypothetical protein